MRSNIDINPVVASVNGCPAWYVLILMRLVKLQILQRRSDEGHLARASNPTSSNYPH